MSATSYPAHVDATLESQMSRWLWLVKWLLVIPHYFLMFFLWMAFDVVSVIAFFAILFTGRYPRALFDFNVGVLRWTWRVGYYADSALGTDKYPPFSLSDVPDYPAHFDVDYPQRLSRGLVLVKWWLLAIPHYFVVGVFLGGGTWAVWRTTDSAAAGPGLIGLMVLIAAVALGFTGRYPRQIFDFVLGMNRWALRVAAYAGLMTDEYPPFRLDMGGHETAGAVTISSPPEAQPGAGGAQPPAAKRRRWTGGRVVALVAGCVIGLMSLGLLGAGGFATWATNTQRDTAGYLSTDRLSFATHTSAITTDRIDLGGSADVVTPGDVLGTVRIRVRPAQPGSRIFVGVGPQAAVDRYLSGVNRMVVNDWMTGHMSEMMMAGATPRSVPAAADIWTAQSSGPGLQSLTWRPASGHWVVVVMNANGSPGVAVTADVGATVPDLGWIAAGLLIVGAVLLVASVVLIVVPVARASR